MNGPSDAELDVLASLEARVAAKLRAENHRLREALDKPLRETILAVLTTMPAEAAPEHLAAMIESQVRAWQAIPPKENDR